MKVLLINGSPNKQGNTYTALAEIASQLDKHHIESEIVWIGHKPVRGCIACCQCRENGNNKCAFDDDITNTIISKMTHSDAVIIGSPVYYGQPAGPVLCMQQEHSLQVEQTSWESQQQPWPSAAEVEQQPSIRHS